MGDISVWFFVLTWLAGHLVIFHRRTSRWLMDRLHGWLPWSVDEVQEALEAASLPVTPDIVQGSTHVELSRRRERVELWAKNITVTLSAFWLLLTLGSSLLLSRLTLG